MDNTNLNILRILLVDGRASYHKIGEQLGLSSNTVKTRVTRMMDDGVIDRFITQVKFEALGYDLVYASITHGSERDDLILDKISLIGHPIMAINCVGGTMVLGLASRGELEQKMELLRSLIRPSLVTNIFGIKAMPIKRILRTDLMLIKHLLKHPRAHVNDTAKTLGISTRTVKRRLDFLVRSGLVQFSIQLNPAAMRGFIQFSLMLDIDEQRYNHVVEAIYRELGDHFLLPPPEFYQKSMIVVILYSDNVYTMDEMFRKVSKMEGVKNVELFIPTEIDFRQDWFVKLIDMTLKKTKETLIVKREDYVLT